MSLSRTLAAAAAALWIAAPLPAAAQETPKPPPSASSATPPATPPGEDAPKPAAADAEAPAGPDPAKKEEAREHFLRGLKLLKEDAWQAALAEFLLSRELYPTRSATTNAGVVLRKLERFDESLDMFEAVLRDFGELPPAEKQLAQRSVAELRELVGTIEITGSVPGASIVVDGHNRADYPLIDPLRVGAGSHAVRVFKEGFEPFEARVEVAGGQTIRVPAKLEPLRASGRLRVAEKGGKKLEVVVDGAVVGVTPWEGVLSIGDRVVLLRGDEDWGSPPVAAKVKSGETSTLTLEAARLESSLAVSVLPAGAAITIDAVTVGSGVWDGRLQKGAHRVEAKADGFFARAVDVSLDRGEREQVTLKLERDEDADKWRKPSKIKVELVGGFGLTPSFGGDVAGGCEGDCSRGVGVGALGMLHGTYEFGSGFGVGVAGGWLHLVQSVEGRAATLKSTGLSPSSGTTHEDLRLGGFLVGATAGLGFDASERVPALLRLGVGALVGSARNVRGGTFATRSGSYEAPDVENTPSASFLYLDPEARIGVRVLDQLELSAGVQALFLIAISKPRWGADENPPLVVPGDGFSTYPDEALVGDLMVVVAPSVGARYTF